MILYELNCSGGHAFDAWFKDADSCDRQIKRKIVECPVCGGNSVAKALMAPRIGKSAKSEIVPHAATNAPTADVPTAHAPVTGPVGLPALRPGADGAKMALMAANMRETLSEIRKQIEANCDYVGGSFAEEARKIHYGEAEARGIYGEATDDQHQELVEEGVEIARIPWLPRGDA
jgi:hypothetical protein